MTNGRSHHTASFLLSHFLNSKESLLLTEVTSTLVSILRYMYDVMEMTYSRTNLSICDKSISQIALYSRNSPKTVKRSLPLLCRLDLLSIEKQKSRCPTHYGIGKLIASRVTMTLVEQTKDETRVTMTPALGSPRPHETPNRGHHDPYVRKVCKKDGKKERGAAPLAPSPSFLPDDLNRLYAIDHRLDMEKELSEFVRIKQRQPRDQVEFRKWLDKAVAYKERQPAAKQEVRSTVPEFGPGHPAWEAKEQWKRQQEAEKKDHHDPSAPQPVQPKSDQSFEEGMLRMRAAFKQSQEDRAAHAERLRLNGQSKHGVLPNGAAT